MAKSQGWKRPEDAECLKAPFTGKLDGFGKMTLIVSNKVYFLGKSIFLPLEDVRHKICLYELSPKDVGQSQIEQLHKIDECVVGFHILEKDALYLS